MIDFAKVPVLAMAGVLSAGLAAAAPSTPAGRGESRKEVRRTLPLEAHGRLEISTYKGSVEVSVWDRPEAEIAATVEADGFDSDSESRVADTEIRIEGGGSSVRVKSDYDRIQNHHLFSWSSNNGPLPFVRYRIRMPATARLAIEDYKSDTRVSGLRADLKLHTYKGTGRIDGLDGAADVDTYKGEIALSFSRYSRASRLETYKGRFEVTLPRDSRFELDAEGGRRGEIDSDFAVASHRSSRRGNESESARGSVNGGGPSLRFESTRGSLRLRGV